MLAWLSYLYMPVAVVFYLYHRNLPSIKHRMPVGTACAGTFASIYCLALPLCTLFGDGAACGSVLLVLAIAGNTAVISMVWTAFVVLVLYSITEIIAQPTNVPHDRVAVWNYFRGMLIPSIQIPAGVCVCVLWNLPHMLLLVLNAPSIALLSYTQCAMMDIFDLLTYISIGQCTVILGGFLSVAYQLRHTMDTFSVRWSYEYTSVYMLVCGSLSLLHRIISVYTSAISGYHLEELLTTQALQGIVFFNVLLPLLTAYRDRHKVQDLTGSTSLQVNWDSYLKGHEGYMSFMEFCRGDTAILLAWKACVDFQDGNGKLNAFELYQTHLATEGPYSVYTVLPDVIRRRYTKKVMRLKKKSSLVMNNASKVVPVMDDVDADFFEPLRRELVRIMVTTALTAYERDDLGKEWLAFHTRRRSIHSLEYVQKVASKADMTREANIVKQANIPMWGGSLLQSKSSDTQIPLPIKEETVFHAPESPSRRTGSRKFATEVPQRIDTRDNRLNLREAEAIMARGKSQEDLAVVSTEATVGTARKILFE
ncbi:Aste57867_19817 [Aphanomyces stellatus]|uniref:Aste57867_19817 protein n=1 Tax=Aphanomyces stellatus TaxID=120398 RepID=A0A485LFC5_9STRA|nr:hypothetical protein As57867_019752 [Aphanomyces stellatus]VFT96515.1 Aste57867_19817 [Aphanomyces stellatus]